MMIRVIQDVETLSVYIDGIVAALQKMIRRTGLHGQSIENVVTMMFQGIVAGRSFLLVGTDEDSNGDRTNLSGLLYAQLVQDSPPWVEVVAMWSRPGRATKARETVFAMLREWAKRRGATKIISVITRSPDRFYEFFHKPLGFKKVGIVVEVEV